ncbi:26S proteasome non-ATPase regulatory subunit 10, partial [Tremellales sp. Uapishka_1]
MSQKTLSHPSLPERPVLSFSLSDIPYSPRSSTPSSAPAQTLGPTASSRLVQTHFYSPPSRAGIKRKNPPSSLYDEEPKPQPLNLIQRGPREAVHLHAENGLPEPKPPVSILPIPLPSKRFKKKPTSRAVLLPVEQLPVYPLPPLPTIDDPALVKQVFTHSSLFEKVKGAFEDPEDNPSKHYEKLEHVGDSILGMIVTTWLHETKPRLTIGTATKLKSHLVSNATLSHLSGLYNLPQRLNGDPQILPVLRAQTDVRAALVEAYIAALYFSFPPPERSTVAFRVIDEWLREMYEPLYEFFYKYMKKEHDQHWNATGSTDDGIILTDTQMKVVDNSALGMTELVRLYTAQYDRVLSYEDERFETNVGYLWKIKCLVDGIEMGEATRAVKAKAKNVASWEAAKKLGIAVSPAISSTGFGQDGRTPLHWAATTPNLSMTQLLLSYSPDVEARDAMGWTPLMIATTSGNVEIVTELLNAGANVNAANEKGQTPLHYAASKGHVSIGRLLINKGADINAKDRASQFPLHRAATTGSNAFLQLLLNPPEGRPKTRLNGADRAGNTPLHLAVESGHGDTAVTLIEAGADRERPNVDGEVAEDIEGVGGQEQKNVRAYIVSKVGPREG